MTLSLVLLTESPLLRTMNWEKEENEKSKKNDKTTNLQRSIENLLLK